MIDFADQRTEFKPLAEEEIYPGQSPALNFIEAILGKAPNGSPGELGLASMEIIEAACESAQTNRSEKIRAVHATTGNRVEKSPGGQAAVRDSPRMSPAGPTHRHRVGSQPRLSAARRHGATLRGNASGRPHPLGKAHARRIRPHAD